MCAIFTILTIYILGFSFTNLYKYRCVLYALNIMWFRYLILVVFFIGDHSQIFEPFGAVELVQLPLDLETNHCKGFGFVQVSMNLISCV